MKQTKLASVFVFAGILGACLVGGFALEEARKLRELKKITKMNFVGGFPYEHH